MLVTQGSSCTMALGLQDSDNKSGGMATGELSAPLNCARCDYSIV